MKKLIPQIFSTCLIVGLLVPPDMQGQGTIVANNLNGAGPYWATSFGLFFDANLVPYTATPINVTILGGPDANSLTPIVTLSGPNALVLVAFGRYTDPSAAIYTIPGVA